MKELVHAAADLIEVLIYQIGVLSYVWRTGGGVDLLLVGNDLSKYRHNLSCVLTHKYQLKAWMQVKKCEKRQHKSINTGLCLISLSVFKITNFLTSICVFYINDVSYYRQVLQHLMWCCRGK